MVTSSKLPAWLLPAALIFLSLIPVVAGVTRVAGLVGGAEVTPDNARFFAAPVTVIAHIVGASAFLWLGALQLVPAFRRQRPGWHRRAGRVLVACGIAAGLTGLWMTLFFPHVEGDGPLLFLFRLAFGSAMVIFLALGFAAARRRRFAEHGAWMTRGYAIGMGAGTQAVLHLPFLALGMPGELGRALLLGAGWLINLAVAEWSIRRTRVRAGSLQMAEA
jgi:hypothetical protein